MNHGTNGRKQAPLTIAGLFAGIGGVEVGFHRAGHEAELLCEIDPGAANVLRHHFPDVPLAADIRAVKGLPNVDIVTAGFPCQDLSQAGRTAGISGTQSSLIGEVFRLLDSRKRGPRWLVLENVSFMLQLARGGAMRYLADELEIRGYSWAYRVVDTRAFGLPQRRQRVILVASKTEDPRTVLFADDEKPFEPSFSPNRGAGSTGLRDRGAWDGRSTRCRPSREAPQSVSHRHRPYGSPRRARSSLRDQRCGAVAGVRCRLDTTCLRSPGREPWPSVEVGWQRRECPRRGMGRHETGRTWHF